MLVTDTQPYRYFAWPFHKALSYRHAEVYCQGPNKQVYIYGRRKGFLHSTRYPLSVVFESVEQVLAAGFVEVSKQNLPQARPDRTPIRYASFTTWEV